MTSLFEDPRVAEMLGPGLVRTVNKIFAQMEVAEDEIARARGGTRLADSSDPLWGAFLLVRATHPIMGTEFVYRAHCREILARVAAGEDTRPATDAELACHISDMSQVAMLTQPFVTLQTRIFQRRFPEQHARLDDDLATLTAYEASEVDDLERQLRRRHREDWRR